jgi:hypothetical protein
MKIVLLFSVLSVTAFADVATWNTFKSAEKYFVMELPCTSTNVLVKTDDNKSERLYKCNFAGSDYSVDQIVYTKAGKKYLETHPSLIVEDTVKNLTAQYKKEGISVDTNVNHRAHPYRVLDFVGTGNKKKYVTKIYDGPEAQLIFTGVGPVSEESNLKHVSDSIKPN